MSYEQRCTAEDVVCGTTCYMCMVISKCAYRVITKYCDERLNVSRNAPTTHSLVTTRKALRGEFRSKSHLQSRFWFGNIIYFEFGGKPRAKRRL